MHASHARGSTAAARRLTTARAGVRAPALLAVALFVGAGMAAAAGNPPARVAIDHVRVMGKGQHELIVRVEDGAGAPVEGLESDLGVTLDDHGVGETRTEYSGTTGPRALFVVVDAPLLRGEGAAVVDDVLRAVARELAAEDRVTVVLAGDRPVTKEWNARDLAQAGDRLASVAAAGGPRLLDALKLAIDKAGAKRRLSAGALLVVTRGDDRGSRARAGDVLAAALHGGVTSLAVVVVSGGEGGGAQELERMATLTGGTLWRTQPGVALPPSLGPGMRALLDRYRVTFRDTRWQRDGGTHRLEAHVGDAGAALLGELRYVSNTVYESGGGAGLAIGIVLVLLLVGAVLFVLSRRQKQACLLVVREGEDEGQWYEVFELPVRIGSMRENDIVIVQPGISRKHCLLEREGRAIVLVDTNSELGTFVNGARVTRHVLEEDDVIRLGSEVELAYEAR